MAGRAWAPQWRWMLDSMRNAGVAAMLGFGVLSGGLLWGGVAHAAGAAPAAGVAHAVDDGWWVSLGVYATPAAAGRFAAEMGRAAGAAPRVLVFERDGRTLHRVAIGPYDLGQPLHGALRSWRSRVRGAFAVRLGDGVAASEPLPVASTAALRAEPDAGAPDAGAPNVDAPGAGIEDGRAVEVPRVDGMATRSDALSARRPGPAAPAVDPMAAMRLDPGLERLLRDDAALQRELERLSRGLPRGLGNEIEAAQAQGVSLRDARARMETGPQSPTAAPAGYQLHRLRRSDATQAGEEAGE